jgi:hypothetical protein
VLQAAGLFASTSTDLVVVGSARYPVVVAPQNVDTVPVGTYTGNTLDEILLGAEVVTASTTMHARGVPYHVGLTGSFGELRVQANSGVATLAIEKGVKIRFDSGGAFVIQNHGGATPAMGALVAVGSATEPIVLTSAATTPKPGDWNGLQFGGIPDVTNAVEFVHVEYAGRDSGSVGGSCEGTNIRAAISLRGEPTTPFIVNSVISDSLFDGINRGWSTPAPSVDFLATNTFTNVIGCDQTNPAIAACMNCMP